MKNKILSFVLAAAMVVTILPTSGLEVKAETNLSNPRIVEDSSMEAGQKVTWDCVWFGNYPQTEIVDTAARCGTTGKTWAKESDYDADSNLYNELQNASGWDARGDITLNGVKYRRIQNGEQNTVYNSEQYSWSDTTTYHYFRYEPIKWRVLSVNGNNAFLISDIALDYQRYSAGLFSDIEEEKSVSWDISTIRGWLNGYGESQNINNTSYSDDNFKDTAFSSDEQKAIIDTDLDNTSSSEKAGEFGGNNTTDSIFLLSAYDLYYSSNSKIYGFSENNEILDEARLTRSSTYAKAMGDISISGNTEWWMTRSPGAFKNEESQCCIAVRYDGYLDTDGFNASQTSAVRPALNLNLSSTSWSSAGTVCSDGTVDEIAASGSGTNREFDYIDDTWSFRNQTTKIPVDIYQMFFSEAVAKTYQKKCDGTGGQCAGMVNTVAAIYNGAPKVTSFTDDLEVFSTEILDLVTLEEKSSEINCSAADFIQYGYAYQMTKDFLNEKASTNKDYDGLYDAVYKFQHSNGNPVYIAIGDSKGGHALMGIGIAAKTSDSTKIQVYDCNQPNEKCYLTLYGEKGNYTGWKYGNRSNNSEGARIGYLTNANNNFIKYFNSDYADSNSNAIVVVLNRVDEGILKLNDQEIGIDLNKLNTTSVDGIVPITVDSSSDDTDFNGYWFDDSYKNMEFTNLSADNEITISKEKLEINASCDSDSDISINTDEQTVTVKGAEDSTFNVSYENSEDYENSTLATLTGNADENAKIVQKEDGTLIVSGVDELNVTNSDVEYTDDGDVKADKQVEISSDKLSDDKEYQVDTDGKNVEIKEDTDGDGNFETHVHTWNEGKVTKEPTCATKGEKIYTCTICKETKTGDVDATGKHTAVIDKAVNATNTSAGKTEGTHCSVCGKVITAQKSVGSPISSVTLYKGVNKNYILTSNGVASWRITSGSKYATLKGPTLTVKKAGKVVVKDSKSGKSVTVTIKNPSISTKTKVSVKKGKSLQLKATVTPKATVKYSLVSKKYKKYATVTSSGKITGKKKGTCYIYAKANGVKKKIKVTVK